MSSVLGNNQIERESKGQVVVKSKLGQSSDHQVNFIFKFLNLPVWEVLRICNWDRAVVYLKWQLDNTCTM